LRRSRTISSTSRPRITIGDFNDDELCYFLPRALELIAQRVSNRHLIREYLDLILERGKARITWPKAEVEAIDRVLAHVSD
jgi:hypothetical protein